MSETVRIIVNGIQKPVKKTKIVGYDQIVRLTGRDPLQHYHVTYDLPGGGRGTLTVGQVVRLSEGTIFTVTSPDKV